MPERRAAHERSMRRPLWNLLLVPERLPRMLLHRGIAPQPPVELQHLYDVPDGRAPERIDLRGVRDRPFLYLSSTERKSTHHVRLRDRPNMAVPADVTHRLLHR